MKYKQPTILEKNCKYVLCSIGVRYWEDATVNGVEDTEDGENKQATETSIAYNELAKENEELKEILERHKKATAKSQIRSCDLEIINAELKELLKECKMPLEVYNEMFGNKEELLTKIDEALK